MLLNLIDTSLKIQFKQTWLSNVNDFQMHELQNAQNRALF